MKKRKRPRTAAERKEYLRQYAKRWRAAHPNYSKEWQAANREYVTQQKRKYRARKRLGFEP